MDDGGAAQLLPYQNPRLSFAERAQDLCSRLTLEEKASLMCDVSPAIPRLGIKPFNWWSEALHGYANNSDVTVFPEPIGMAASFNPALVYKVFTATSDEARGKYNLFMAEGKADSRFHSLSVWTPNVNIFRDPRWGRGQETYGEDPYLTSVMGVQVVKGSARDRRRQNTENSMPAPSTSPCTAARNIRAIPPTSPISPRATYGRPISWLSRLPSSKVMSGR